MLISGDTKHFLARKSKDSNRVNLREEIKKIDTSETHFGERNLLYLQESIGRLKSDGAIKIRSPIVVSEKRNCDRGTYIYSGYILTKGRCAAQIGIFGFLSEKVNGATAKA